jgi:hypothetical protein
VAEAWHFFHDPVDRSATAARWAHVACLKLAVGSVWPDSHIRFNSGLKRSAVMLMNMNRSKEEERIKMKMKKTNG